MAELEALQTVAALSFFPHHVQHAVDQLGTFGVVSLCPQEPSRFRGLRFRVLSLACKAWGGVMAKNQTRRATATFSAQMRQQIRTKPSVFGPIVAFCRVWGIGASVLVLGLRPAWV